MQSDFSAELVPDGGQRIELALSGDGFRATLYHLGVIRYLHEVGLLGRVSHVCSVSGGSIIAAHLVLNWERYTGNSDDFDASARELVEFTLSDLRGSIVLSWLFSFLAPSVRWMMPAGHRISHAECWALFVALAFCFLFFT